MVDSRWKSLTTAALATHLRPGEGHFFYNGAAFVSTAWRPDANTCEFSLLPHVVEEVAELKRLIQKIPNEDAQTLCNICMSAIIVAV